MMFSPLASKHVCTLGNSAVLWPYDDDRNWVNALPSRRWRPRSPIARRSRHALAELTRDFAAGHNGHCVERKTRCGRPLGGHTAGRWLDPVRGVGHREARAESINPKNIAWPILL